MPTPANMHDFVIRRSLRMSIALAAVASVLVLAGCMTPAIVQTADDNTRNKALSFEVPSDRGRVYFVSGTIKENIFGMKHKYPSNFFVHGQVIGSKNPEDVLVFDLKPGQYEFQWGVRSTDPIDKNSTPETYRAVISGGRSIVLRGDYSMGGAMFGLVGSMVSPPKSFLVEAGRDDVIGKSVVVPQSCHPGICLK
jgi:hypothetical protein